MKRRQVARVVLTAFFLTQLVVASTSGAAEPTGDFFDDFDADGDGVVSSEEFDGPEDHFSNLDANADGYISADEGPTGPPGGDGEGPGGGPGEGHGGGPGGDGPGGGGRG